MNALEFRRRQAHLTQGQLAERTGVPQVRISEYERGLRPAAEHLRALAAGLGVPRASAESLLREVPPEIAGVPPAPSLAERIRESRS